MLFIIFLVLIQFLFFFVTSLIKILNELELWVKNNFSEKILVKKFAFSKNIGIIISIVIPFILGIGSLSLVMNPLMKPFYIFPFLGLVYYTYSGISALSKLSFVKIDKIKSSKKAGIIFLIVSALMIIPLILTLRFILSMKNFAPTISELSSSSGKIATIEVIFPYVEESGSIPIIPFETAVIIVLFKNLFIFDFGASLIIAIFVLSHNLVLEHILRKSHNRE